MHRISLRRLLVVAVIPLVVGSGGCSPAHGDRAAAPAATGTPDAVPPPVVPTAPVGGTVAAADLAGHWSSETYGSAYIQVDGATIKVVYEHDDGRILATLQGDKVVGWWTEAPTRQPAEDAGDVEFNVRRGDGRIVMHGGWRRGTSGAFTEDWDLTRVDGAIPAETAALFAEQSAFTRHP